MRASKQRPTGDALAAATGKWPEILQTLGGLTADQLENRHQPCPACGGTDRYRWDKDEGDGGAYCSQCGGKDRQGGAMTGIDLLMRVKGWDFRQAIGAVGQHLGMAPIAANNRRTISKATKPYRCPDKPPADAPPPALDGAVAQWCYRDTTGAQLYWVQRYPKRDGSKGFIHRVWLDGRWHRPNTSKDGFTCDWPTPRPMYGLPGLVQRPDAPVLVVEGEKAADAAALLLPDCVVVSWSNGSEAIRKVDWQPLAGRSVTLWPDNDAPGQKAMLTIAARLVAMGGTVAMVRLPEAFPDAWDVADPMPEGFTAEQILREWSESVRIPENPPAAAAAPAAPAGPPPEAPYRVLGWCENRKLIYYQHRRTGQIASLKPAASPTLLSMGLMGWWETNFPGARGVNWASACSSVIEQADMAGVFALDSVRGRGVWREGGSVVWHLGDRLEVDGREVSLIDHGGRFHYARLRASAVNPAVAPLTDQEGMAILQAVRALWWKSPLDPLHLLGWVVLANVGGALKHRPILQASSHSGSGKSSTMDQTALPLLPGATHESASSGAGIRQGLRHDVTPVVVDESENEDPRQREEMVKLARLSFDGKSTSRGTQQQEKIEYAVRSAFALIGINAEMDNEADRNRTVVVGRVYMPTAQYVAAKRQLQEAISEEVGARLMRRTVTHLRTLLANVTTFGRVVEAQLGGNGGARAGDLYGALLAGAHLLTSTDTVSDEQACSWLDAMGWSAVGAMGEAAVVAGNGSEEGMQCLSHLLAHEEPWRADWGMGRVSMRELIAMARRSISKQEAKEDPTAVRQQEQATEALGRRGICTTDTGLVIANDVQILKPIYGTTRWPKGGHKNRLRDLPNTEPAQVHFPVIGTKRGTKVPWVLVDGASDTPEA